MLSVEKICGALFTLAPREMKMDWDNVGLLCGRKNAEVRTALVALDLTEGVLDEALALGAELIVTHHPAIFEPLRALTDDTPAGRLLLRLAKNDIAVVSLHTNLDCAPGGVNDVLAAALGLADVRVLEPAGQDAQGRPYGLLRAGTVPESDVFSFAQHVKSTLACPGVRVLDAGKPVRLVAVGGGSCGSEMGAAVRAGCDTFVTADVKYHQFADALAMGLNLIDAGHFETENPACAVLASFLQGLDASLSVRVSETHGDPVQFL